MLQLHSRRRAWVPIFDNVYAKRIQCVVNRSKRSSNIMCTTQTQSESWALYFCGYLSAYMLTSFLLSTPSLVFSLVLCTRIISFSKLLAFIPGYTLETRILRCLDFLRLKTSLAKPYFNSIVTKSYLVRGKGNHACKQ